MDTLWQDIRFSCRMLVKSKGFAVVAVLTLALGIGANTAIFSVMNAVVLRYLPVPDPGQLVYLHTTGWPEGASQTGDGSLSFTMHTFDQLRVQREVFSDLMAFVPLAIGKVAVRYGQSAEEARANMVSGSFFSGLGVRPDRGQLFTPEDESRHTLVAVLSHGYWTVRFGRDPSVLGQPIYVKGIPFTIIGIAASDFAGVD